MRGTRKFCHRGTKNDQSLIKFFLVDGGTEDPNTA